MAYVKPLPDFAPVPRIEVSMSASDLPAGADRVTVSKVVDGTVSVVRGAVDRAFVDELSLLDLEAPFSAPVTYVADAWAGGLPLGRVTLGATVLPVDATVIQQPLNPSLNVTVTRLSTMGAEVRRGAPLALAFPEGRRYPTMIARGPRRAISQYALDFIVDTADAADAVVATLGSQDAPQLPVWLVRTPPPQRLPRMFFCAVPDLIERDLAFGAGPTQFTAVVDEIAPPAPGLVVPPLTYDDLDAAFTSYTARDAAYPTYSRMDADWSLANLTR